MPQCMDASTVSSHFMEFCSCGSFSYFCRLPLTYIWTRKDYPIPDKKVLSDNNRILEIPDVQLEDEGVYICTVSRTTGDVVHTEQPLTVEGTVKHKHSFNFM